MKINWALNFIYNYYCYYASISVPVAVCAMLSFNFQLKNLIESLIDVCVSVSIFVVRGYVIS